MFDKRKELNKLKGTYGHLLTTHANLKMLNNKKTQEIMFLRRNFEMMEKKCKQILDRGKQYTKKSNLGRKYKKYKGTGKVSRR